MNSKGCGSSHRSTILFSVRLFIQQESQKEYILRNEEVSIQELLSMKSGRPIQHQFYLKLKTAYLQLI